MNKYSLDSIDREIISLLKIDGRASLSTLADKVKVSRGTIQNRLDKLQASGVLLGFTVRVKEDYGLYTIRAFMMIKVIGKSTAQVIRSLNGFPELVALHTTNGSWDLISEIQTSSLPEFDRVLREVRLIDGITSSETSLLLTSA